jgi:hypothetical protein
LGAKQVGKAAICAWRDVILPAIRNNDSEIALWPFEGTLDALLRHHRCVVAETYPAEACVQLGLPAPGNGWSKARQSDRTAKGKLIVDRLRQWNVMLSRSALAGLENGFGPTSDGEDQFDSFVGLAAMLAVLLGIRSEGFPDDDDVQLQEIQRIEGWIFGQTPTGLDGRHS